MADTVLTETATAIRTYEELRTRLTDLSQWTSTPLTWFPSRWLYEDTQRLDAGYYADDVFAARRLLTDCGFEIKQLQTLGVEAYHLTQSQPRSNFKRIYTTHDQGTPFLTTSQIYAFRPDTDKYLSPSMEKLDEMLVSPGVILISRSGTVARPVLVGQRLSQFAITDDAIRVQSGKLPVGYLYAYLCSWIGQTLLRKNQYGVTVKHLESPHLLALLCPRLSENAEQYIHSEITHAYALRDEANDLLDEADALLHHELGLPHFNESLVPYLTLPPREDTGLPEIPDPQAFIVNAEDLNERLDASYHVPIARTAIELLYKAKYSPVPLSKIADGVYIPPRFKRIYVQEAYGVPFIRPSQLPQMRPFDLDYISKLTKELDLLELQQGDVLVSTDGTVGRISLVTKRIAGWAGSNNIGRITYGNTDGRNGYIAAFLSSPYGYHQLTREIYGGVVDHIERYHIEGVLIPQAPSDVQRAIGEKVVLAYEKKDEATALEETAIRELEQTLETRAQGYAVDW